MTLVAKTSMTAQFFNAIGLTHPKEVTSRSIGAMILACHFPDGSPVEVRHSLILDLKLQFKIHRTGRRPAQQHIVKFPEYARDHPNFAQLFSPDDQPIGWMPPNYMDEHHSAIMRKTHTAVRGSAPHHNAPASQLALRSPEPAMQLMQQMMQAMMQNSGPIVPGLRFSTAVEDAQGATDVTVRNRVLKDGGVGATPKNDGYTPMVKRVKS
jgi:hypothetical protein